MTCGWCGQAWAARDHTVCAAHAAHWRGRGYEEDWVPDAEGVVALLTAFWGDAAGSPTGSVRGDLRQGCWDTLRWVLGLDESGGRDFAHWAGMANIDEEYVTRALLADWTPAAAHHRCARCGVSYDRHTFQYPSMRYCKACRAKRRLEARRQKRQEQTG